ncbi:MAG: hypothetical protein Kow0098_09610 [Ignavibacteriaceae bacterium]
MVEFRNEVKGDIIIEQVNLKKASSDKAELFKKLLLKDIENGWNKIIVDLSKCEIIDSTFLSAMIVALKEITNKNGSIKIVTNGTGADAIIELTGINKVLESYKSVDQAVKSFNGSVPNDN